MANGKIPFYPKNPDLDAVRQIVVERLRRDTTWKQLHNAGEGFAPFVDYVASTEFERQNGRSGTAGSRNCCGSELTGLASA